jgi:hypothetical protein
MQALAAAAAQEGFPIRRDGNVQPASDSATARLEAVYQYPFQAHAPLEPMNCAADVKPGSCEIWAPTQAPETAYQNAMKKLGLQEDAVEVHTTLSGGAFGRRLFVDYADEAVEVSKAIGKPVQVVWRREDDMRSGFFHPASIEKLSAALTGGKIAAWQHKSVGSDLSMFGLRAMKRRRTRNTMRRMRSLGALSIRLTISRISRLTMCRWTVRSQPAHGGPSNIPRGSSRANRSLTKWLTPSDRIHSSFASICSGPAISLC